MAEFITRILDFSGGFPDIWYRGEKFHKYNVEPSAYRYTSFKEYGENIERQSILAARSSMLHIAETQQLNLDLNWLCYLQHNGLPTRLLDWSVEFQVALYFAFEDYIKQKAQPGSLPCLWGFRPVKFSEALAKYLNTNPTSFDLTKDEKDYLINNVLNDLEPKDTNVIADHDTKSSGALNKTYIPFFSPFVNERAKQQGGCFVRFPLLEQGSTKFPQYQLNVFIDNESSFDGCLAKFIFINPTLLLSELSMLNLSTSRIYPEVENIALKIKNHYFKP